MPKLAGLLRPLAELIASLSLRERIPQIEASHSEERSVLVFRVLDPPSTADLAGLRSFSEQHEVDVLLQSGGPETVRDLDGSAPGPLFYELDHPPLRMGFGPGDFIQVNDEVNRRLVARTLELAASGPNDRVVDLFCGLGNFSLPLATRAGHVTGVEIAETMVQAARGNAERNGLLNVNFVCEDLSRPPDDPAWLNEETDLVVLDPPRAGAKQILGLLARARPRRIIYISCHPATLARDAGALVREAGYGLNAAGVVDMFPQTAHAEAMAVFDRV